MARRKFDETHRKKLEKELDAICFREARVVLPMRLASKNIINTSVALPHEILDLALWHVPLRDLLTCSLINRHWYAMISNSDVWQKAAKKHFGVQNKIAQWTWKRTFLEMVLEQRRSGKRSEIAECQRQENLQVRARCGMRRRPSMVGLQRRDLSLPGEFKPSTAWPVHPNSEEKLVAHFDFDFGESAANLLRQYDVFNKVKQQYKKAALMNPKEMTVERQIKAAIIKYERFLKLKSKYPRALLVPTAEIQMAWSSHMIRPHAYRADMERMFGPGVIIPHKLVSSPGEMSIFPAAIKQTKELWDAEYPDDPYPEMRDDPPFTRPVPYCYGLISPKIATKSAKGSLMVFLPDYAKRDKPSSPKLKPYTLDMTTQVSVTTKDIKYDLGWYRDFLCYMCSFLTREYLKKSGPKSYERFLYFCWLHRDAAVGIHPTYAIDLFWHVHMCHPQQYEKDTKKLTGRLLDHTPDPEYETVTIQDKTDDIWIKEFGIGIEQEHKHSAGSYGKMELLWKLWSDEHAVLGKE